MRPFFAEGSVETGDGEALTLVCDFFALDVIEQVTGQSWDDILPELANPPRALAVKVLYGLLRKRHPGITLDEAAGVAFDKNQAAIGLVMGDVIRRACNIGGGEDTEASLAKKKPSGRSKVSAGNG